MPGLAANVKSMLSTYCWPFVPWLAKSGFLAAVISCPGVHLVMVYGPVPSGLRLISLPTLATHALDITDVKGIVIAYRNEASGLANVICTVYRSTTLKPEMEPALPSM